jgi:GT2 family glycosyltransferase
VKLSVIVVTHNAAQSVLACLAAVRRSALASDSYEIVVVDDASTDESVAFAARYADTVIRLTGRCNGPAYARNRGVEFARGEILAFIAGDVVVQPDTLPRLLAVLSDRPDVAAVSAAQDQTGGPSNFVSRYWNLLVQFGEQRHADRSVQFAARCGAVRRSVFIQTGMYDEWRFTTDCVEGADLAERLRAAGHGVVLASDVKVVHLKRWRLDEVFREVWSRGRLVARCLGYTRMSAAVPGEVVFTLSRSFTPAVALLATLTLAAAFVPSPRASAKVVFALAALMLSNFPMHRFYSRARGVGFAVVSAPLHICVQLVAGVGLCVGWILRDLLGDVSPDAATQAYSEVGLEIWPPVRRRV